MAIEKMSFEQKRKVDIGEEIDLAQSALQNLLERFLAQKSDFSQYSEKISELTEGYPEKRFEQLNLTSFLGTEINALYWDGAISKKEAETLLLRLKKSKGRDSYLTLAIVVVCGRHLQKHRQEQS
ncbi:MAG TPA: hypothetical protein VFQ60_00215 [Patescibacteria group bacterium]|nr:hypothetical protein [Patescibacteria group bacterium]